MNNLNSNLKENKIYDFQKRLYTSYSKFTEVKLVTIGIASPLRILQWAEKTLPNGKIYGEVLNANTLHHKTFKPQKGGLFCERIFGPLKDFQCSCGKIDKTAKYSLKDTSQKNESRKSKLEETMDQKDNIEHKKSLSELSSGVTKDKTTRKLRKFCPDCDVEYTWSVIRRYQLGYIKLISPVTHVWFLKGTPSYISILLDIKKRYLQSITYCSETFTIEHSESAASALQTYKTSGFDLDSPSKIYASWLKAKNMGEGKNSDGIFSDYSDSTRKSLTKEKIADTGTQTEPVDNFFDEKFPYNTPSEFNPNMGNNFAPKNFHLELKKKRLNTMENWKRSKDSTVRESTMKNLFDTMNKKKKLYTNKNKTLEIQRSVFDKTLPVRAMDGEKFKEIFFILNLFQMNKKNISEKNFFSLGNKTEDFVSGLFPSQTPELNSSELSSEFDLVKLENRYLILQFIYVLQLGFIYNNFIQSLFSDEIFNMETYLIQKRLSEKREKFSIRRLGKEIPPSDQDLPIQETTSADEENLNSKDSHKSESWENYTNFENLSREKNSKESFSGMSVSQGETDMESTLISPEEKNYAPNFPSGMLPPRSEEKSLDFSSPHLIHKINKKSPIDLYIKASLQRMLHKKILVNSIVKTWQNVYKKAYIKAMYKINAYYFQTNKFEKIKTNNKFLRLQEKSYKSFVTPSNNLYPGFALFYSKINKNYAQKTTVKYLKNIIQLVKSYFKQNILLTLQNIKQPIFSLHAQNTKNYTIKNLDLAGFLPSAKRPLGKKPMVFFLDDKKNMSIFMKDFKNSNSSFNTSIFCSSDIPIPYSISQLINKKSDEMTNFLSLDVSSLVDLLADRGFMAPLVVGKFFEHTRYNTVAAARTAAGPLATRLACRVDPFGTEENFPEGKFSREGGASGEKKTYQVFFST